MEPNGIRTQRQLRPSPKTKEPLDPGLRYKKYNTLKHQSGSYLQTDTFFVQDVRAIANSRFDILSKMSDYISTQKEELTDEICNEIDFRATLHYQANIINRNTGTQKTVQQKDICTCGCGFAKGPKYSVCEDESQLSRLGSGVMLFFVFQRFAIFMMITISLVYGLFAMTTNILGEGKGVQCPSYFCWFKVGASDESKFMPEMYSYVQWWLGLVFSVIFVLMVRFIKYYGKEKNKQIDKEMKTSSDFAVKISQLPFGEYEQYQLIGYLERLWQKIQDSQPNLPKEAGIGLGFGKEDLFFNIIHQSRGNHDHNRFNLRGVQIIFNMKFARDLTFRIVSTALQISNIYKHGSNSKDFIIPEGKHHEYLERKATIISAYEALGDLRKRFLNQSEFRKNIATSVCLIHLKFEQTKEILLEHYGQEKKSVMKVLKEKLCWDNQTHALFKGQQLRIERAPEPSDILWSNCEHANNWAGKICIYTVTFIIILISFGITSGLDYLQLYAQQHNQDSSIIPIINFVIGLVYQMINKLLWYSLFKLLQIQYNHTLTDKIVSQMNKALFATSINIIVLPIISNYIIRQDVFSEQGLVGIVFDYHFSMVTVGLGVKLLNPPNLVKRIALSFRFTRNLIIRYFCANIKFSQFNLQKGVPEINVLYEPPFFDIAEAYVYIIAAMLHAAFYSELQPSILLILTLTTFLYYWINRFLILRVSKIPQITQKLIFQNALWLSCFVPISYGVGSCVIMSIESRIDSSRPVYYVPSAIAIGIGLFGLINPGNIMNLSIKKVMECCEFIKSQHKVEAQSKTRLQNYYSGSNSLVLFGFQSQLKGKPCSHQIIQELQMYCQHFFPQYNQREIEEDMKLLGNLVKQNPKEQPRKNFMELLTPKKQNKNGNGQEEMKKASSMGGFFPGIPNHSKREGEKEVNEQNEQISKGKKVKPEKNDGKAKRQKKQKKEKKEKKQKNKKKEKKEMNKYNENNKMKQQDYQNTDNISQKKEKKNIKGGDFILESVEDKRSSSGYEDEEPSAGYLGPF